MFSETTKWKAECWKQPIGDRSVIYALLIVMKDNSLLQWSIFSWYSDEKLKYFKNESKKFYSQISSSIIKAISVLLYYWHIFKILDSNAMGFLLCWPSYVRGNSFVLSNPGLSPMAFLPPALNTAGSIDEEKQGQKPTFLFFSFIC